MPDLTSLAASLRMTLGGIPAIAVGGVLLLFGRRLYWFFAGVVGFVVVFLLTGRLTPEWSAGMALLVSLAGGVVGAVVTIFAHRILLALIGGLSGGVIALWQVQALGVERGAAWLLAVLLGGVLGAWLASGLFEFALVLLSSLLGTQLVLDALPLEPRWVAPAYLGLVAVGLFFQLIASKRRRRERRRSG